MFMNKSFIASVVKCCSHSVWIFFQTYLKCLLSVWRYQMLHTQCAETTRRRLFLLLPGKQVILDLLSVLRAHNVFLWCFTGAFWWHRYQRFPRSEGEYHAQRRSSRPPWNVVAFWSSSPRRSCLSLLVLLLHSTCVCSGVIQTLFGALVALWCTVVSERQRATSCQPLAEVLPGSHPQSAAETCCYNVVLDGWLDLHLLL